MRLTVSLKEGKKAKVFKGGYMEGGEEMEIKNYHVLNDVVVDRGSSPQAV